MGPISKSRTLCTCLAYLALSTPERASLPFQFRELTDSSHQHVSEMIFNMVKWVYLQDPTKT